MGSPYVRRAVAAALVAAVLLTGCGSSKLEGASRQTPESVGNITMTNVTTDGAAPYDFRAPSDGITLVYFGYTTCPDFCPITLANLRTARDDLGKDKDRVRVAFITVDPERDTPSVVRDYLSKFNFPPPVGYALRPQNDDELTKVQQAFRSTSEVGKDDNGNVKVGHMTWTYAINAKGQVVVEWSYGTESKTITHDLKILLKSAPKAA